MAPILPITYFDKGVCVNGKPRENKMRLRRRNKPFEDLRRIAVEEAEGLYEELPQELGMAARALPLVCEGTPSEELIRSGVAPETFGLFVGASRTEEGRCPIPSQITLFLENLWAFARGNERTYRDEIRRTLLHELGHYLGFDEDELEKRNLE